MTSEYNHRNSAYEQRFVQAQTKNFQNPRREVNPLPNPIYKKDIQYFDSHVKNSNEYPHISWIRPINTEYTPSNIGAMLDKSIQEKKNFVFGPYILPHREYNYRS